MEVLVELATLLGVAPANDRYIWMFLLDNLSKRLAELLFSRTCKMIA